MGVIGCDVHETEKMRMRTEIRDRPSDEPENVVDLKQICEFFDTSSIER